MSQAAAACTVKMRLIQVFKNRAPIGTWPYSPLPARRAAWDVSFLLTRPLRRKLQVMGGLRFSKLRSTKRLLPSRLLLQRFHCGTRPMS